MRHKNSNMAPPNITILLVAFFLTVSLLETYFLRIKEDPLNPLRPTVVLSNLDNGLTLLLEAEKLFLQDIISVATGVFHLVLRPVYGSFMVVLDIINMLIAKYSVTELFLSVYMTVFSTIVLYCQYSDEMMQKEKNAKSETGPIRGITNSTKVLMRARASRNVLDTIGKEEEKKIREFIERNNKEFDRVIAPVQQREGAGIAFPPLP